MASTTIAPAGPSSRYTSLAAAWAPLAALTLVFLVEMLDNTVLNVALPTIGRDLHAGTTDLQWVIGAYSLTFGGLLIAGGRVADRFGRRRTLMVGLAAFGLLGALVPLVASPTELIVLRAALGAAAALIAPVSVSLVYRLFDDEALRIRSITLITTVGMLGFALGPMLAGSVVGHLPWQVLLVVNAPVALLAALGVARGIAPDQPGDLHPQPIDVIGAVLGVVTVGAASYALTSGVDHGWRAPITLGVLALAAVALAGFVARLRVADHPIIDPGSLGAGPVRGAALSQAAVMLAMSGGLFSLTLHLQLVWGWSPFRSAAGTLPMVVTMIVSAPLVDRVVTALGHRRTVLVCGLLGAVGLCVVAAGLSHGFPVVAAGLVLMTIGIRVVMSASAVALVDALPDTQTSLGAAMNDTAQELGASVGTAVVGTVLAAVAGRAVASAAADPAWAASFTHAEQVGQLGVAAAVAVLTVVGGLFLTDARTVEEH